MYLQNAEKDVLAVLKDVSDCESDCTELASKIQRSACKLKNTQEYIEFVIWIQKIQKLRDKTKNTNRKTRKATDRQEIRQELWQELWRIPSQKRKLNCKLTANLLILKKVL